MSAPDSQMPGMSMASGAADAAGGYQLTLSVAVEGGTDDEIAAVTQEVNKWIREAGPSCDVSPVTTPGPPGARGVLTVLGALGLKFFEPGALKALINCLAVYIKERRRDVTITVKAPNGANVQIHAGGIGHGDLEKLIKAAHSLARTSGAAPHV